jgi:hypothetical protein
VAAPLRVVQLVRRDPVRVIMQSVLALVLSMAAMCILALLLFSSLAVTLTLSGIGLGADKTLQIIGLGPLAGLVGGGGLASAFLRFQAPPVTIEIARFLFSVGLAAFFGVLYALPGVFLASVSCAVYLAGAPEAEPAPHIAAEPVMPTLGQL